MTSESTDFVTGFGGGSVNLCLGQPLARFHDPSDGGAVQNSGLSGVVTFAPDFTQLPQGLAFLPGETWYFQLWFRDFPSSGSTSNLTNGLEVLFL